MSTAQVANTGIVGSASRVAQHRYAVASTGEFVDPLAEAYAPPARDHTTGFDDDFDTYAQSRQRRRRQPAQFQDQVVSFGGVLVSREVGATIMQAQAAQTSRARSPLAADAERGIAVYEFNQALMGTAQVMSDTGLMR